MNAQVNIFNDIFVKCPDVHALFVTRKIKRPLAPWMNDSLRQAIVERKNVQDKLKLNRHNVLLQQEFKDKKKCVKSSITNAKSSYYNSSFKKRRVIHRVYEKSLEILFPIRNVLQILLTLMMFSKRLLNLLVSLQMWVKIPVISPNKHY